MMENWEENSARFECYGEKSRVEAKAERKLARKVGVKTARTEELASRMQDGKKGVKAPKGPNEEWQALRERMDCTGQFSRSEKEHPGEDHECTSI